MVNYETFFIKFVFLFNILQTLPKCHGKMYMHFVFQRKIFHKRNVSKNSSFVLIIFVLYILKIKA